MLEQLFQIGLNVPADRQVVGGRAAGLGDLCRAGARVSDSVVIVLSSESPTPTAVAKTLTHHVLRCHDDDTKLFAVCGSNVLEDGPTASYAGFFESY